MEESLNPQQSPKKKMNGCLKYVLIGFGLFMLIGIIGNLVDGDGTKSSASAQDSVAISQETDTMSAVAETPKKTWAYNTEVDEMTDSKSKYAYLKSDNYADFDFPYNGGSYMTISIRHTKKWGLDVYLSISKGQFLCSEYQGTDKITARFDDGTPIKFRTTEPDDGSSDLIFIVDSKAQAFVNKCKKAKSIKIEASFYQEGNRVFKFSVDEPLEW